MTQLLWFGQAMLATLASWWRPVPHRRRFSHASSVEALHAALTAADVRIEALETALDAERRRCAELLALSLDSAALTEGYKLACVLGEVSPAVLRRCVPDRREPHAS